jgi:hypothetical protein
MRNTLLLIATFLLYCMPHHAPAKIKTTVLLESSAEAPCAITSLTASFLPCFDNFTSTPLDDTYIGDFTIQFNDQPTTGDIELIVNGTTYSTSVIGLGSQFQFLSIPLPADGMPVVATVRFTDDPACSLTKTVGTAPPPCSAGCAFTSLTANFLPCADQGTGVPEDDTYIADFTMQFNNPPTTGDIELEVGGQTYSTSAVGLGTQFQFLSIPLTADGQPVVATARFTADPSCTLTTTVGIAPDPCSSIAPCTELFISECVEGSGFNKCIEIYNPTGSTIDLASYGLFLSFNGGTFENTIPLTGMINSGDVYVVCHSSADPTFTALADQLAGDLNFNGNDVISLKTALGTIDAIGQLGNAATYGQNTTLRRISTVDAGDNNPYDPFTTAEWISYPSNTAWGLGYHNSSCNALLPSPWNAVTIGCPSGTVSSSGGDIQLTSSCFNANPGQDDLTFAFQPLCGDGELIAYIDVTTNGFAGLMFRERMAAGSKYVWMYSKGSNRTYFARRSIDNYWAQTSFRPHFNRKWFRLTRSGNIFRGYISNNGTIWQQLYISNVPMDQCIFAGLAVHSYVDNIPIVGTFSNVQFNPGTPSPLAIPNHWDTETLGTALQPDPDMDDENIILQPNPASTYLEVRLPKYVDHALELQIHNLNGQLVYSDRVERYSSVIRLDLDHMGLPGGLYLLSIRMPNEVITKRFVKE